MDAGSAMMPKSMLIAIAIPIPIPMVPFPGVVALPGCGHRLRCALCGSFLFFLTSIRPENLSGLMTLCMDLRRWISASRRSV